MADGCGYFSGDKFGMRGNNGAAKNVTGAVGEELDKAIVKIVDFASRNSTKFNERFFVFAVAF